MHNLKKEIEDLIYNNASDFMIAKAIKKEIKIYFDTLEESFATSGGKDFLVKHTKKIDSFLKIIYEVAYRAMFGNYLPMKNSIPVALVALGSYGREQLCVYSDIDLMIVYKDIDGYNTQKLIEKIFYILIDTGLKLGHRVHSVDELFEVSKSDITIKTALIESRFIDGSKFVWTDTQNVLRQIRDDNIKEFINLKIDEQMKKHKKYPLTMQPNLKDGVGGFRDANLVYWVGKIIYNVDNIKNLPSNVIDENEYRSFRIALEFLFRVRSALHLVSNKKEDRLRLELIPYISKLLGYDDTPTGHTSCTKKVTESLKIIRLHSAIWLEILARDYIEIDKNKNYLYPETKLKQNLNTLLKELSNKADKPFYPHASFLQQLITVNKPNELNSSIYKIIASFFYQPYSHSILNTLSQARLLKHIVSPLKMVVDLPQFDGYHKYAVDIHSIRCIYHLEHIEDTFIQSLFDTLSKDEKMMLKVVVFLHDSGKGRKGDHHRVGVTLFRNFASLLGIRDELIKLGETLILYHTLMSVVAQREDVYNEKTIFAFASHFKSKMLLDMIYILTYADMNGVGEGIYNSFNSKLINTLYIQSLSVLNSHTMLDNATKRVKKEKKIKNNPLFKDLSKIEQKKLLSISSDLLFIRYSDTDIIDISKKAFQIEKFKIYLKSSNYLTIEIIRKENFNLSYLLAKLNSLEVANMDIFKLFDGYKYFKIDFSKSVDSNEIERIKNILDKSFYTDEEKDITPPIIKVGELKIDCEHSNDYATMNLNTKDQKGLIAFIIQIFDQEGVDITSAKIHTIKSRARDMFLVEKNGNFCKKIDKIIYRLTEPISL